MYLCVLPRSFRVVHNDSSCDVMKQKGHRENSKYELTSSRKVGRESIATYAAC